MPGKKGGKVTADMKRMATEFKERVIDVWEECKNRQEQMTEVQEVTHIELKLSR